MYRLVSTEQYARHAGSCRCFLHPCNSFFFNWNSTNAKIAKKFAACKQPKKNAFDAIKGDFFIEVTCHLSFYWKIIFSLDVRCHMTNYLFFQWLHCLHIEIDLIWLSYCWTYQVTINSESAEVQNVLIKELKSLYCCNYVFIFLVAPMSPHWNWFDLLESLQESTQNLPKDKMCWSRSSKVYSAANFLEGAHQCQTDIVPVAGVFCSLKWHH